MWIEVWWLLAASAAILFVGIVGGIYYAGWDLEAVFVDNPIAWLIVVSEFTLVCLLWVARPWKPDR